MFSLITCPTCNHKLTIPEGDMGKLRTCPNCRTRFLAGASVAEQPAITYNCPRCDKPLEAPAIEAGTKKPCPLCGQRHLVPAAPPVPAEAGLNKTMLTADKNSAAAAPPRTAAPDPLNKTMLGKLDEPQPTIRFNCPRCGKPQEAPASEAGTKKNCSSAACGQRLQVPAISAAQPNLNKTMLASDGTFAIKEPPVPLLPQSPAQATPSAADGQVGDDDGRSNRRRRRNRRRDQTGDWPLNIPRRVYAIAGIIAGSLVLLYFIAALFAPRGDREAIATAQKQIEKLNAEIQEAQKKFAMLEQQKQKNLEMQQRFDAEEAESKRQAAEQARILEAKQNRLDKDRRDNLLLMDQKLREAAEEKRRQDQDVLDRQKEDQLAKEQQEHQRRLQQLKELAADEQRQQEQQRQLNLQRQQYEQAILLQQTIINSQPHYPWYHPWYRPW